MKTPPSVRFIYGFSAGFFLLTAAYGAPPALASAPQRADAEAKPYVLFMSTDVAVQRGRKLYPIKDVSGKSFIVSVNGQLTEVPMHGEPRDLEFKHALVLARATASLTGLQSERTYTPATDPRMVRQREAVLAAAVIGDNASLAEGQYIRSLNGGWAPGSTYQIGPAADNTNPANARLAPGAAPDTAGMAAASQSASQAQDMMMSNLAQGAAARMRAEADLAQEQFDAVAVSFDVSSQTYLEKPYLIVITRFHLPNDKPGTARNAVYAKALESIGGKPRHIEVLHGGFPHGFEIEDLQVHLYNEGREIATDVSQKRVPLTRDEAFEYLKIEYLGGHKGESLSATPALGRPSKEQQLKLTPNQWKAVYYVKVSKEGVPLGTYADEACSQPVDETIGALAKNVRFYPALENGKPTEGTARLEFSELVL
jgi:hypothetical protein